MFGTLPKFRHVYTRRGIQLSLSPSYSDGNEKMIKVDNGSHCSTMVLLKVVPGYLDGVLVALGLLIVEGAPFNVISGIPTMRLLRGKLDYGEYVASFKNGEKNVMLTLGLDLFNHCILKGGTDSE